MGFGDSLQKAIDTILGNDDKAPAGSDGSDGGGISISKSLFGGDDEPSDADALPEPAEDIPMEPHAILEGAHDTLVIWALDEWRRPMPRAPYRLRAGDDVRLGHADEAGRIEELEVPVSEMCVLSWGEPTDDSDGFTYARELYVDMEDVDDPEDRQLYNLAYFGSSTSERLAQFQADYDGSLEEVHENGGDGGPMPSDSDEAIV